MSLVTAMVTDLVIALVTVLVTVLAGYLKALERGNSVPRPKGFCEADKVNFFSVLLQNLFISIFGEL